jgi:hypothetical protein
MKLQTEALILKKLKQKTWVWRKYFSLQNKNNCDNL